MLMQAGIWGSILPAVWSFMLAARLHGLGTAWTTVHLYYEQEAAEVLGIPYEQVM
ncbi:MAG TPA: nitroreductase family protein [Ktedonobacteraceae bacterium]|nr:nitroreductase family protein [Ktedonobacteraceae bacterium]